MPYSNHEKQKDWKRKDYIRRRERISKGLCHDCNQPHLPNSIFCEKHLIAKRESTKRYVEKNREKVNLRHKVLRKELQIKALKIVGKSETPSCTKCGCSDYNLLEINHKNGNGNHKDRGIYIWTKICNGTRGIEDLEVTCKVCNVIHYCQLISSHQWEVKYFS